MTSHVPKYATASPDAGDGGSTAENLHLTTEEWATARTSIAWTHIQNGDLKEAQECLESVLAVFPCHGLAHSLMGTFYFKIRKLEQAAFHLSAALQINPEIHEAAATLAWVLHDQGKLPAAIIWARRALCQQPSPQRKAQLGWLFLCSGEPEKAIPFLEQSCVEDPNIASTHVNLARSLAEAGQPFRAIEVLQRALAQMPNDPEILLAMAWSLHERGDAQRAITLAKRVIQLQPDSSSAHHLLGTIQSATGELELAQSNLSRAFELNTGNSAAALELASILRSRHQLQEAISVLDSALTHQPHHLGANAMRVQLALDSHDTAFARRHIHTLIKSAPNDGDIWYLFAQVLHQMGRSAIASAALSRAVKRNHRHAQAWFLSAQIAMQRDRLDRFHFALAQWLQLTPDTSDANTQTAFLLIENNQLAQANSYAERAISQDNTSCEAWRALSLIRQLQLRLRESEAHARRALSLCKHNIAPYLRQIAWSLRAQGQFEQAAQFFWQAIETDPTSSTYWFEYADTMAQIGAIDRSLECLEHALTIHPRLSQALILRLKLLTARATPADCDLLKRLCTSLLRQNRCADDAAIALVNLASIGDLAANRSVSRLPKAIQLRIIRSCLESAQFRGSQRSFNALATWAKQAFPDEPGITAIEIVARSTLPHTALDDLTLHLRNWQRVLYRRAQSGVSLSPPHLLSTSIPRQPLRLAYVASHFHRTLLCDVLAAHDPTQVEVFLYCDLSGDSLRGLPETVHICPLHGQDLVASMYANQIDVAIDTVGVTGVLGQDFVLQQFARRLAPVQCAWIGSWASAGGVFDYLLTDEYALPIRVEAHYDEGIERLPGGQWAWTPPLHAPVPSQPPCLTRRRIALASPVRAFRIGSSTLRAWAEILQKVPNADLVLMGEHCANLKFRSEFEEILTELHIDPNRVSYQPHRPYDLYLQGFDAIDIVLDTFPANGGLCLLDAIWMGIPFVTLAGHWLGERQGLSILAAIGHTEWVASTPEQYVDIACELSSDPHRLAALRHRLRSTIANSPLVDKFRIARAIEEICIRLRERATPIAQAPTDKERTRAVASLQLDNWLAKSQKIDLAPIGGNVDLSVVVVLFNQAGLSRQCFAALADQRGVCFETVVVDNASADSTSDLLPRLSGVTLIRNTENVGFLHAAKQGAALARGRHILFLNNDAIVHAQALQQAAMRLDSDTTIGAVGGRIILGNGLLQEAGCIAYRDGSTLGYGRGQDPDAAEFAFLREVDFCSGAFLMLRRSIWNELGGFDAAYAPAYYEDTDLCLRIHEAGYRVVYDPSVLLTHFEWGSATTAGEATQLMEQRREKFMQRHFERLQLRPHSTEACPHRDRWLSVERPRILFIDNAVPHRVAGGGLPRARLLIRALSNSHHVTLFPLWSLEDDWGAVYSSVPENVEVMLGRGAEGLEAFLEERRGTYQHILVSRPPNMAFVDKLWSRRPELFDEMRLIYDAEALFSLREIGHATLVGRPLSNEQAEQLVREELNLAHRAEAVLCVSTREAERFQCAGSRHVVLLGHAMSTRTDTPCWSEREHLLFVGAIHPNTPNEDSLIWYVQEIMPLLQKATSDNLRIDVVGECTSGKVEALACDQFQLIGPVDDLTPWYDAHRVFIAPTRYGAGIPAKVIEAACNGIPVVATSLLIQQLGWENGRDIAGGDSAEAFAQALLRLYQNIDLWNSTCLAMAQTTRQNYDPQAFSISLQSAFNSINRQTT